MSFIPTSSKTGRTEPPAITPVPSLAGFNKILLALYFIIKWAVKNGIKEAYRDITGKVTTEDIEAEQICNEEEK